MIRLAVRVSRERAEVVLAELLDLAPGGIEEVELDGGRVEYAVYGPPGELPELPDLEALAGEEPVEISTTEIADDWQERWRHFHRPILIEAPASAAGVVPAIRIRPPWEPAAAAAGAIELVVDPGQAFGTGGHATTRLCLTLLLELSAGYADRGQIEGRDLDGPTAVLDVGTGSGVLAIAAGRLGFSPLLGLDNELESVEAAQENARVNGVELRTESYDLRRDPLPWLGFERAEKDPPPRRTLMLANLLRPLLIELSASVAQPPAAVIASGLLTGELDEISEEFARRHSLRERRRLTDGDWGALLLVQEPDPAG